MKIHKEYDEKLTGTGREKKTSVIPECFNARAPASLATGEQAGLSAVRRAGREAAALYRVGNNGLSTQSGELNSVSPEFTMVGQLFGTDRFEGDCFSGIAEGDVETIKNAFSSDQIKADAETRGKADSCLKFDIAYFDGQMISENGNLTAVANRDCGLESFLKIVDTESFCVLKTKDTKTCSRIYITPHVVPAVGSFDLNWDDGRWKLAMQKRVFENYRAQLKSSGLGMGKPVGMTPGCLRLASLCKRAASLPTNNSPSATTAYFPAYLSTSSLKCLRTHSWSSIFLFFALFLKAFIAKEVYHRAQFRSRDKNE